MSKSQGRTTTATPATRGLLKNKEWEDRGSAAAVQLEERDTGKPATQFLSSLVYASRDLTKGQILFEYDSAKSHVLKRGQETFR